MPSLLNPHVSESPPLFDISNVSYEWNNDLPPEDVRQLAMNALQAHDTELREVEKAIKVLNITVNGLWRRAYDISQQISRCKQILSPIRHLPDELLQEIFHHCLPTDRYPETSPSEAPVVLTHVCRKWRTIAISTPQLWTRIHIFCADSSLPPEWMIQSQSHRSSSGRPQRTSTSIHSIESWLMRSANHPLFISLRFWSFEAPPEYYVLLATRLDGFTHYFGELAHFLARHARRWSTFSFMGPYVQLVEMIGAVAVIDNVDPFPRLRKVKAHCTHSNAPEHRLGPIAPMAIWTPTLRVLSLQGIQKDLHDICWRSLTSLSIHNPTHRHVARNILRHCTVLESCGLKIIYVTADITGADIQPLYESHLTVDNETEVRLPSLKTLCIQGELDDEANICRFLHAPALQHFLFYPKYREETVDHTLPWHPNYRDDSHPTPPPLKEIDVPRPTWSPLCQFLARCTALQKLTVNPAYLVGTDIIAILQSCSQITSLVLDQHDRTNYAQQGHTYLTPDFKYNLYPLFKQQLFSLATRTVTDLKVPLLPSLKSFSVRAFYASNALTLGVLAQFCINRIQPIREAAMGNLGVLPHATLERIDLHLCGTAGDIASLIKKHASLVGRAVGKDLAVKVVYPWDGDEVKDDIWPFVDNDVF